MRSPHASGAFVALLVSFAAGMPGTLVAQEAEDDTLKEVLVTASKRGEQSLLDTPMSIQAITSEQLQTQGITQFTDYARSISGLAFESQGPGDKKIVIRGLDSTTMNADHTAPWAGRVGEAEKGRVSTGLRAR